jgi:16S rRNA (guanine966-N2)-methyltransferase
MPRFYGKAKNYNASMSRPHSQEVRLIGGRFKRTPLAVPDLPGLRPTPSRVRETLFNWLGQSLSGWRVLDAFAGSGALGLEAASRDAEAVTLLEQHPTLVQHIQRTVSRLGAAQVQVHRADAMAWMARCAQTHPQGAFDLVLLDPPFEHDMFDRALALARGCVVPGGYVYLEAPKPMGDTLPEGVTVYRQGHAGAVYFHLLQCGLAPAQAG